MIQTFSLCTECYAEIPAVIELNGMAVMHKICALHGAFSAVVEKDAALYETLASRPEEGNQPSLLFVEVTRRCNANCTYCYSCKDGYHPPLEVLKQQFMALSRHGLSFALTGGEPTMRDDFLDLAGFLKGNHTVISNSLKFGEAAYLDQYLDTAGTYDGFTTINPSIHARELNTPKQYAKKLTFLAHLRARGLKVATAFFTVETLAQVDEVIETAKKWEDVIASVRIRCAAPIGCGVKEQLFPSDIIKHLNEKGKLELLPSRMAFIKTRYDNIDLMIIGWYSATNVDLLDMHQSPPFYLTRNGEILTVNHAILINEGIDKGWLRGQRVRFENP